MNIKETGRGPGPLFCLKKPIFSLSCILGLHTSPWLLQNNWKRKKRNKKTLLCKLWHNIFQWWSTFQIARFNGNTLKTKHKSGSYVSKRTCKYASMIVAVLEIFNETEEAHNLKWCRVWRCPHNSDFLDWVCLSPDTHAQGHFLFSKSDYLL